MARYIKELPIVDYPENSYAEIGRYLTSQKFTYRNRDGEVLFQKGKGFWVAPSFVKVSYTRTTARVEAWIDAFGDEQDLEGFVGCAAKKPLQKIVSQVECILQRANTAYLEQKAEEVVPEEPVHAQPEPEIVQQLPTSKKEYYKKYAGESFYMNLRVMAIFGYILCGISLVSLLINPLALVDLFICLGLVLGMHLGRSKGCAIGITIYAAVNTVVMLIMTGTLGGWAWLIVGIYSLIIFNNADKRYRKMME